jgi:hypothetical protein
MVNRIDELEGSMIMARSANPDVSGACRMISGSPHRVNPVFDDAGSDDEGRNLLEGFSIRKKPRAGRHEPIKRKPVVVVK